MSDEDNREIAKQVLKQMPRIAKDAADVMRLIEIAKKSIVAGVNADFLERMEMLWAGRAEEMLNIAKVIKDMAEGKDE